MNPASILVLSPFETPDASIVAAAHRAGAIGVLDLGRDEAAREEALKALAHAPRNQYGIRIPEGVRPAPQEVPENAGLVVLAAGAEMTGWEGRRVFVQVTSLAEALEAEAAGAHAIIAKGSESGGRIGDETAFVLVQRLLSRISLPIWVQGGVGMYTAAGCMAAGVAGIVLDSQLACVRESNLAESIKAAVRAMDGSETVVIDGHRVYSRPDLPIPQPKKLDIAQSLGADDLTAQILPAGADAAFAKPFADAYQTVGGVVRALCAHVDRQLRSVRARNPLAKGSDFAREYGLNYPIAQGPMTRVSDVAPFAKAVANDGALPFLALALMRGAEVRALLLEASNVLAGQTWGVGILGFVPPELREEQLEVIREFRPPVVLIAGGRPSQSRPLEAAGIPTFLHVPSPGLLDLFLGQGARRFVFEGLECGGHVGPRSSFVLWEAQVERLMRHERPEELSILFAGGVHDALSAAIVAAIAAPLAERGAKVGALMGTAYVFTDEAVRHGAIRPSFQEAALACQGTVLLETAPGHATRCANTEYVMTFQEERARLVHAGVPAEEIWASLETLNLGRLRIAAKGLRREGDAIIEVDAEAQRDEGMVMIGEVAALRTRVNTIAELHKDVSDGSTSVLAQPGSEPEQERRRSRDVAIVGMAAIMPGAPDLEAFWANIVGGVSSITEVPPERWNPATFYDPQSTSGEKTPSKWGGFLDPVPFDPVEYGLPPLSLGAIEPVQLLALEVSHRALRDAGYLERDFDREHTSVIFGAEAGTDLAAAYGFRALWRQYVGELPDELGAALPSMTEDSFPGILANVIAGRVANRLDLRGSNFTVDAACASSLAAVDLACKELLAGTSEMVICGGADLHNSIIDYLAFASVHALSPSGKSKTFDASGDGITLGEGVAAVVLKRLEDAERDGDRIYALIKGVGSSSDGRSLGLTAPRLQGEELALERAYANAGISPAEIGLVEAHGTGTVVGDRTELEALTAVFARAGATTGGCTLGSVKSQIGHTKCAAGLAGLIKASLALHRRVLPPTLNIDEPNAAWSPQGPFTLNKAPRPWPGSNRMAGVSAFGFGGTNFHVVLSAYEAEQSESGLFEWPSELFLFKGNTQDEALAKIEKVAGLLEDGDPWRLRDLAWTVSQGTTPARVAIVATNLDDLKAKLVEARKGRPADGVFYPQANLGTDWKLAYLFPGQGSQRIGMLGDLFIAFPELQSLLEDGPDVSARIFPPTAWSESGRNAQKEALTDTRIAQPALGIAGVAMAKLLSKLGVQPQMLGGHSFGEIAALAVAGVIPQASLLSLSRARAKAILEATGFEGADRGTMAAVLADAQTVERYIAELDGAVIANENSPAQTVISGQTEAVRFAVEQMKRAGLSVVPIPVACAFHSPLVARGSHVFRAYLDQIELGAGRIPVFSNTTTEAYPQGADAVRDLLAEHIAKPVRFAAQIESMYAAGARVFVEVGPGTVLTNLVARTLQGRPHLTISTDQEGAQGITRLLEAVAQLAVNGVALDVSALFQGRDAEVCDLESPSSRVPSPTTWWVNGQRAWPMRGEPPSYALKPVLKPVVDVFGTSAGKTNGEHETVVLNYMRAMRESMDQMSRVVSSYLGTDASSAESSSQALSSVEPAIPDWPRRIEAPTPVAHALPMKTEPGEPPVQISELLLGIVSERTGYPLDMLDPELDLEADLSIDSIKRVEIIGTLTLRLGISADEAIEALPEDIVRLKTLRAIIDALTTWMDARGSLPPAIEQGLTMADVPTLAPPSTQAPSTQERTNEPAVASSAPVVRYLPSWSPTAQLRLAAGALSGLNVVVKTHNGALLDALRSKLLEAGAAMTSDIGSADVLVDLRPAARGWSDVASLFDDLVTALEGDSKTILVATSLGKLLGGRDFGREDARGAGVAGLVKSLAKERRDCNFRIVNVPEETSDDEMAEIVCRELGTIDDVAEVLYAGGTRQLSRVIRQDLYTGTQPQIALNERSRILVTGGARGITSRVAIALAERFGCHLDLVGRTKPIDPEQYSYVDETAGLAAIRQHLIAGGLREPAAIEAAATAIVASSEIRATLRAIRERGGTADYHALDVRDTQRFGALIDRLYERHGRIDGVIHGAGVVEDALAGDKNPESFRRVFETKVNGALVLAEKIRDDAQFVVFFGSVAGVFGNRGQTDYAAANDFVDKLALSLNAHRQARVVSIDWGPWSGTGMVSPELANEYSRRGYALIEVESGVQSLLAELLHGPKKDAQVLLTATDPSLLV